MARFLVFLGLGVLTAAGGVLWLSATSLYVIGWMLIW